MFRAVCLISLSFVCVNSEYLTKKLCKDVDTSQCDVHNVLLDPCAGAPAFCSLKRNKRYTLSVDFTPKFSTNGLNLAIYGDDSNTGSFNKVIKAPSDGCDVLTCPVEANMRRIFDLDFSLNKNLGFAKFPVKVKMWSQEDDTQTCCFTFNVKIAK